jgi:hypothetical protein
MHKMMDVLERVGVLNKLRYSGRLRQTSAGDYAMCILSHLREWVSNSY